MKGIEFRNEAGITFKQITKVTARKMFEARKVVMMVASNERPFTPWHVEYFLRHNNEAGDFEAQVNGYTYYNCINSETGKYPRFYAVATEMEAMNV